jgi:hypothetical protein
MPNGPGGGGTADLWLRILTTIEAGAASNKLVVERSTSALESALVQTGQVASSLSTATASLQEHTSRLEELVTLKLHMDRLGEDVRELQEESKAGKVGKGDLIWKVLVGLFALVASALGGTLISLLLKSS